MPPTIFKAVIFDWGGVLIDNPAGRLVSYCSEKLGVDSHQGGQVIATHLPAFARGEIAEELFWKRVGQDLNVPMPESASLWNEAFGTICRPREAMYDLAQALHKDFKTAVLSNTELAAKPYCLAHRADYFDVKVFSCDEGFIKPQRELYEICLQRLEVKPQEAIFIDDLQDNVAGARAVGLQAIHYVSYQELLEQLQEFGIHL